MFVAVASEFAAEDHRRAAEELLSRYGFQRVLGAAWESVSLGEEAVLLQLFWRIAKSVTYQEC